MKYSGQTPNPGDWDDVMLVYDGYSLLEEHYLSDGSLKRRYYYESVNELVLIEDNVSGDDYIPLLDDRGTVMGLARAVNGQLVEKLYYNATGLCRSFDQYGTENTITGGFSVGRSVIPFGWLGMYHDEFTGKYHTHFREYDPVHGRWLTEDPSGYRDGLNLYAAYMGVNGIDPLGLGLGGQLVTWAFTGRWVDGDLVTLADYGRAAAEGARGGASIVANTYSFGLTDKVGLTNSSQYQGGAYTFSRFSAMASREAALWATGAKLGGLAASGASKLGTLALGAERMATATYYTAKGSYYAAKGFAVVNAARGGYAVGTGINHIREGDYEAAAYSFLEGTSALGSSFHTAYSLRGVSAPTKPGSIAARQQHVAGRTSSEVAARAQKARILKNVHSSRVANNASRFELHSGGWPGNRGFIRGKDAYVTLSPGAQIDRFGRLDGDFASVRGTPFRKRGMFNRQYDSGYNALRILKPIENVRMGPAMPWAGNPGGAFQFDFERTGRDIGWFVANDYMKIIKGAARPGF